MAYWAIIAEAASKEVGGIISAGAQKGAIKMQQAVNKVNAAQQQLEFSQKMQANLDNTQRLMAQQVVAASAIGAQGGAISTNTLNKGMEENKNLEFDSKIASANADMQNEALSQEKKFTEWQLLLAGGQNAASTASKLKSTGSSNKDSANGNS